jgi:hypothetical protein
VLIKVKVFSRDQGHTLESGIIKKIIIEVAQFEIFQLVTSLLVDTVTKVLSQPFYQKKKCHIWQMEDK